MSGRLLVHFVDGTVGEFDIDGEFDISDIPEWVDKDVESSSLNLGTATGAVLVPPGQAKYIEWITEESETDKKAAAWDAWLNDIESGLASNQDEEGARVYDKCARSAKRLLDRYDLPGRF